MTDEEILEMANQLKYTEIYADGFVETSRIELIAFARLIAAKQREIDAGIADRFCVAGFHTACDAIAAAIRGQK
jgi:hypothetical protein